jgi:NitT/TauT family transport system substrate-binding protein
VRVRFGHVANPFSRPVDVAIQRGYFDEAGVDLDVVMFANGSTMSTALVAGEVDAGVGGHLQTLLGGQVFFGPLGFEESPDHLSIALVTRPDISNGRELEGSCVGVSARGAISELQLRIFMRAEGADYTTLRLEAMPFREFAAAMESGAIAAASAPGAFADELADAGLGRVVDRGSLSRGLPPGERALITGLAGRPAWVEDNPDAARCLAAAIGRAIDDLAGSGGLNTPRFDRRLEVADLQRVYDLAFDHGLIAAPADAADLIRLPT